MKLTKQSLRVNELLKCITLQLHVPDMNEAACARYE